MQCRSQPAENLEITAMDDRDQDLAKHISVEMFCSFFSLSIINVEFAVDRSAAMHTPESGPAREIQMTDQMKAFRQSWMLFFQEIHPMKSNSQTIPPRSRSGGISAQKAGSPASPASSTGIPKPSSRLGKNSSIGQLVEITDHFIRQKIIDQFCKKRDVAFQGKRIPQGPCSFSKYSRLAGL
jgi:hypothetical protein